MEVTRRRPLKLFEVIVAHGPYRKGDRIQPTGMYRDVLLKRGFIREVVDAEAAPPAHELIDREVRPPQPELALANRARRSGRA